MSNGSASGVARRNNVPDNNLSDAKTRLAVKKADESIHRRNQPVRPRYDLDTVLCKELVEKGVFQHVHQKRSFMFSLESPGKCAWLGELFVVPECCGQGISSMILDVLSKASFQPFISWKW